jgi:hypothetical protein
MSDPHTFLAYIDESGDEGFRFGGGSSAWFVLAAVIVRRSDDREMLTLIDEVREGINQTRKPEHRIPPKKPLHFRDLKHEPRKFFVSRLATTDVRAVCVLVRKPDLASPEKFTAENRLYFYSVRLLIERVSWYCRDHKRKDDAGDGSVQLVLSNRSSLDYDALAQYLTTLEQNRVAFDYRAEATVIRPAQIATFTSGRRAGLQLADAVASSFFYAVEPNAFGLSEDTYARLILPRMYRHNGMLWGYGVKIVPRETEEKRRKGEYLPEFDRGSQ